MDDAFAFFFLQNSRRGSRLRWVFLQACWPRCRGLTSITARRGNVKRRLSRRVMKEVLIAREDENAGERLERRGSITSLCVFCDCIPPVEDKYSHVELEITGRLLRSLSYLRVCVCALPIFCSGEKEIGFCVVGGNGFPSLPPLFFKKKHGEKSYFPFVCSFPPPTPFFSIFLRRFID